MSRFMACFTSTVLLTALFGCCGLSYGPWHGEQCESHVESSFCLTAALDDTSGPGLVYGTADFSGGGAVLIKIQVEDKGSVPGNTASVRAWSGNGEAPAATSLPLPPGDTYYESDGVVSLRHWTTHILRDYDSSGSNGYWVVVEVVHRDQSGNPLTPRTLRYSWPSNSSSPDSPHDFDEY